MASRRSHNTNSGTEKGIAYVPPTTGQALPPQPRYKYKLWQRKHICRVYTFEDANHARLRNIRKPFQKRQPNNLSNSNTLGRESLNYLTKHSILLVLIHTTDDPSKCSFLHQHVQLQPCTNVP